uniref:Uncharacterized protein n=1 Tax=Peronospora matthiolae TaxID=2874970 RepID=A0AAV1TCS8_9STRA
MDASQLKLDEDEQMRGAIESGLSASALGTNFCVVTMRIDALEQTERKAPAKAAVTG